MTGLYIASEPDKIHSDLIHIGHNNFCSTDLKYYPHSNDRTLCLFQILGISKTVIGPYMCKHQKVTI